MSLDSQFIFVNEGYSTDYHPVVLFVVAIQFLQASPFRLSLQKAKSGKNDRIRKLYTGID